METNQSIEEMQDSVDNDGTVVTWCWTVLVEEKVGMPLKSGKILRTDRTKRMWGWIDSILISNALGEYSEKELLPWGVDVE